MILLHPLEAITTTKSFHAIFWWLPSNQNILCARSRMFKHAKIVWDVDFPYFIWLSEIKCIIVDQWKLHVYFSWMCYDLWAKFQSIVIGFSFDSYWNRVIYINHFFPGRSFQRPLLSTLSILSLSFSFRALASFAYIFRAQQYRDATLLRISFLIYMDSIMWLYHFYSCWILWWQMFRIEALLSIFPALRLNICWKIDFSAYFFS